MCGGAGLAWEDGSGLGLMGEKLSCRACGSSVCQGLGADIQPDHGFCLVDTESFGVSHSDPDLLGER